jgi:hypothetical protein
MHNIKQSIEYAVQTPGIFVKQLTPQSVLAAIRSMRQSRFALHPWSTTIRFKVKQGMAPRRQTFRESGARAVRKNNYDRSAD